MMQGSSTTSKRPASLAVLTLRLTGPHAPDLVHGRVDFSLDCHLGLPRPDVGRVAKALGMGEAREALVDDSGDGQTST